MPERESQPAQVYRALPQVRVTAGPGCARGLVEAIGRAGAQRALVITGPTIADSTNLLWYVEQLLGPFHAGSYTGVRAHTPIETIAEASELVQAAGADALVSVGGGSAIDTAKAVAHELSMARGGAPPHIALPTTLSAAEFTPYAGVTGTDSIKRAVAGDNLVPREVFLDPQLTVATPARLWLSSGIKALDHAIESMMSIRHHPVTDTLALEAVRRLLVALPACADDGGALAPRGEAQLAAWMSLFSPATSRGGLSHALGHQLGARGVPHGITSCITLPPVLRFLEPVTGQRQVQIATALGMVDTLDDAVERLVDALGLPGTLRETGIEREDLPSIAEAALPEVRATSQREIADADALRELLEAMW